MDKILSTLGYVLVAFVLVFAGYWLGSKNTEARAIKEKEQAVAEVIEQNKTKPPEVKALEVVGVHWLKLNELPQCPSTHPVKGKVNSDGGIYYSTDHKNWGKIKPQLCFANEEYARDKAFFEKKY